MFLSRKLPAENPNEEDGHKSRRRNGGENVLVQSTTNVRSAHMGIENGSRKGRKGGRRRKELWLSLSTVEPATISPGLRRARASVDFAEHMREGRKEGRAMCACEGTTRAVYLVASICAQGGEEPNTWSRALC